MNHCQSLQVNNQYEELPVTTNPRKGINTEILTEALHLVEPSPLPLVWFVGCAVDWSGLAGPLQ